jgi:hypothetical protein
MSPEQDAVNAMIDQGLPLDQVEDFIDMLALSREQQTALWLLAWAGATDPEYRQRFVAEILLDDRLTSLRDGHTRPVGSVRRAVWSPSRGD